ncbi:tryptophan 7-halogenase [Alteromonas sp. ASW11-19]|uniref:Tryptophan 7-halogenase n=1 Tax=Alteromonas salexigens TaxID=2982530 RepID=A0ABT2VQJ9_9ALTE|nr:tryptophan halogenase family protein [Alteromonas salexigens]MCU7555591.1 tryptophan 7-halogenase [Alteromonas salexigens]
MSEPMHMVIVGGGTAGWMAANLFAHHLADQRVRISLIESPDLGTIGVGEGSTPTLKRFFNDLGIAESEWMPACHATYKVNIRFAGWSPQMGVAEYSHPFISQLDTFSERPFHVNSRTRRLGLDVETTPEKFLFNGYLANRGLAPVTPDNFPFRIEYGYHFDSGKLGEFLRTRAVANQVEHIQANITEVITAPSKDIQTLQLADGRRIEGDFFVDCSGFRSLLLQNTLKVPFRSFKENLFNGAAVVLPTPAMEKPPVETRATALSNGWTWQIPLTNRTGNGYVYSTDYLDKDSAETELRRHLGLLDSDVEARFLNMRVGQTEQAWSHNCLGLGLSQGFIEPLEATALHLVQLGIEIFIDKFTAGELSPQYRDEYNAIISERFERVRDYIVGHYKLNTRDDSAYWRDNRNNMALSESLLQLLDVWYRKGDLTQEIQRQQLESHFGATSWHCMLAGYGIFPPVAPNQPGTGDLLEENGLPRFFEGCALNFQSHTDVLTRYRPA